jgi:hypothetical protein
VTLGFMSGSFRPWKSRGWTGLLHWPRYTGYMHNAMRMDWGKIFGTVR